MRLSLSLLLAAVLILAAEGKVALADDREYYALILSDLGEFFSSLFLPPFPCPFFFTPLFS
jgi:hypothetical protein